MIKGCGCEKEEAVELGIIEQVANLVVGPLS